MTVIGLHIPKCAGSSLLAAAKDALEPDALYQNTSLIRNFRQSRPEWFDIVDHDALRFVWGHWVHEEMMAFFNRPPILVTCLRDPKERLVSGAKYQQRLAVRQSKAFDLEAWLVRQANPMCRFLIHRFPRIAGLGGGSLFEKAQTILEHFSYVFLLENYQSGVRPIEEILRLRVDRKAHNKSPSADASFELDFSQVPIEEDSMLYDWAKGRLSTPLALSPAREMHGLIRSKPKTELFREFLYDALHEEFHSWGNLDEFYEQTLTGRYQTFLPVLERRRRDG